jgi:hypothetical protein
MHSLVVRLSQLLSETFCLPIMRLADHAIGDHLNMNSGNLNDKFRVNLEVNHIPASQEAERECYDNSIQHIKVYFALTTLYYTCIEPLPT